MVKCFPKECRVHHVFLHSITMSSQSTEYVPWPSSSERRYWSSWDRPSTGTRRLVGTLSPCEAGGGRVPVSRGWGKRWAKMTGWPEAGKGWNWLAGPASWPWSLGETAGKRRWWSESRARGPVAGRRQESDRRRARRRWRWHPAPWWSSPPAFPVDATWLDGSGTTPKITGRKRRSIFHSQISTTETETLQTGQQSQKAGLKMQNTWR